MYAEANVFSTRQKELIASMTQGDIIHGFRLLRKYPSGDFKGTLYAFEHEKSVSA